MQIGNSYNINFSSKKLYAVELARPNSEKKTKAFVSELDDEDKDRIAFYKTKWKETTYGEKLSDAFSTGVFDDDNGVKFLAVECPQLKEHKRIKAMVMVEVLDDYVYIDMLQSESQLNPIHGLKGAGSCLFYAIIKMAEQLKKMNVKLNIDKKALNFYLKCGMDKPQNLMFEAVLHSSKSKEIADKLQEQYNIREHIG